MKKIKECSTRIMAVVALVLLVYSAMENTVLPCYVQAVEMVSNTKKYYYVSGNVVHNNKTCDNVSARNRKNECREGIMYQLEHSDEVICSSKSEGERFESTSKIYSKTDYQMCAANNIFSGVLVAQKNIAVSGQINSIRGGILYSKTGDIVISGNEVNLSGILYAPKGKVQIDCETLKMGGCIISENVIINSSSIEYLQNNIWIQQMEQLGAYHNSKYVNINMYYNEKNDKIGIEDIEAQDINLYIRYDDNPFHLVTDYQNGDLFDLPEEGGYFEAYAKITNLFGERKLSDIETFQCEQKGYYSSAVHDTDDDGIPDGYEMRDNLGDWKKADTDGDGLNDGEAQLIYGLHDEHENFICIQMKREDWDALKSRCGDVLTLEKNETGQSLVTAKYLYKAGDEVQIFYNEDNQRVTRLYNVIQGVQKLEIVDDMYTMFFYDIMGQLNVRMAYDGENYIYNEYEYGKKGLNSIQHNDMEYRFQYDAEGRVKDVKINDSSLENTVWKNEQTCTKTFANGDTFIMKYDDIENLIQLSDKEKILYQWTYDKEQHYHLTEVKDKVNGMTYTYQYDEEDEVNQVVTSGGYQYAVQTDGLDKVIESSYGDISVSETFLMDEDKHTYQCKNLEEQITDKNRKIYIDGEEVFSEKTEQNEDGEKIVTRGGTIIRYQYDSQDLLREVWENETCVASYEYNNLKELVRENSKSAGKTFVYQYDEGGNIQQIIAYPLDFHTETANLQSGTQEASYEYDTNLTDQMTSYKDNQIYYDEAGNPVKYWDGSVFTWTQAQRLHSVENQAGKTVYSYNHDGERCLKKQVGRETKYFYRDGNLVLEAEDGQNTWYRYDALGQLVGFEQDGILYLYELNSNNDVTGIMDTSGKCLVQYQYDAWGKVLAISGDRQLGEQNPFRYHSYYYDNETGFYYLYNRYYDPEVKRMLNMDSYTDTQFGMFSHNLYVYCENTPVNASNHSGNVPKWVDKSKYTAQDYLWETKADDSKYNCYGYAINRKQFQSPGYYSNSKTEGSCSLSEIVKNTIRDLKKLGHKPQEISQQSINDFKKTYHIIAVRTGGTIDGTNVRDYHFMKLRKKKYWCHKPGDSAKLYHKYGAWELSSWQPKAYKKNTWCNADYSYSSTTKFIAYIC